MGMWLCYRTGAAVSERVKGAIEAEAQQLAPPHNWWTESLNLFDPGKNDGRLYGSTKIFLMGYSTDGAGYIEVDPAEDSLMTYRDICFILDKLAAWSRNHGLSWEVDCVGEQIGTISNGEWDGKLRKYMDGMKAMFAWPTDFDDRVKQISEKYASRW